jgi:putative ABC transport system substrate-binding protein
MPRDEVLRLDRRRLLQSSLALAGLGLLTSCDLAPRAALWGAGLRRIGYLATGTPTSAAPVLAAFRTGLAELGYVEGQGIALEIRYAEGRADTLPALAAELVALPVDLILTDGNVGIVPAQRATATIPIVFTLAEDPVADGFAASMGRPGGNLTGLTVQAGQEEAKRLQLMREIAPSMTRVAVLWPATVVGRFRQVEAAAPVLGLQLLSLKLDRPDDLDAALTSAVTGRVEGLIVIGAGGIFGPLVPRIVEFTVQNRWPSVSATPSYARVGGLLGYGANAPDLYRRAAAYVDKILRGANPGELPIELPTKFEFVINLTTAQAIGLTIPPSVLVQATEVIQ